MNIYKMKTYAGGTFDTVALEAKKMATEKHIIVEFNFNGILCKVNEFTDLNFLWRDYANAHLMEWKIVGPDCQANYADDVQDELDKRKREQEERRKKAEEEMRLKDKVEREAFEKKVRGITIEWSDEKSFTDWKSKNTDPYGGCVFEYAEGWAKLMQVEIAKGISVKECAEQTSHQLGFLGITGFMYGAAVSILSKCWKYGEELRKWHNKEYNHEGEGVVNPALLTVSIPQP